MLAAQRVLPKSHLVMISKAIGKKQSFNVPMVPAGPVPTVSIRGTVDAQDIAENEY